MDLTAILIPARPAACPIVMPIHQLASPPTAAPLLHSSLSLPRECESGYFMLPFLKDSYYIKKMF